MEKIEEQKGKVKLSDEMLDQVSGGMKENDFCEWSSDGSHEWEQIERADGSLFYECKLCFLRSENPF